MLAITLAGARAWANGAFPDSLRIFVPADRPSEIVLVTNFGLVTTTDGGATWDWVCEHGDGYLAYLYQQAAPPSRRIFAVAPAGLVSSDDGGCSWAVAADLGTTSVTDVFADPVDPDRVLALAAFVDEAGEPRNALFISTDAGETFGSPAHVSPPDWTLASVEAAAADPRRIYLTAYHATAGAVTTHILRSDDGGRAFSDLDVSADVGNRVARIAAVDPVDPDKIYLRLTGTAGTDDAIGVSRDGGARVTIALAAAGQLTALLRRANGEILVSALDVVGGILYRSTDGGATFSPLPTRLGIRAIAERGGTIYVAADDVADGFALGVSADGGATFGPRLRFDQVSRVRSCGALATACAATCAMLVQLNVFAGEVCLEAPADAGIDGGGAPPDDAGCGCRVSASGRREIGPSSIVLLALLGLRRRRLGR